VKGLASPAPEKRSAIFMVGQVAPWSAYLTSDKRNIRLALAPGGAGTREQEVVNDEKQDAARPFRETTSQS
jgi:hypothetical protein